jgi:microsomal dipeptidase-like Zn-dependent dipeptidase
MAQLAKLKSDLVDVTDKMERETKIQVDTLTMEMQLIRDKAMSALKLKSGVDIVKAEKKRKEVTEKVNKLTSMKNAKLLGKELDVLKTQTKLVTKKM